MKCLQSRRRSRIISRTHCYSTRMIRVLIIISKQSFAILPGDFVSYPPNWPSAFCKKRYGFSMLIRYRHFAVIRCVNKNNCIVNIFMHSCTCVFAHVHFIPEQNSESAYVARQQSNLFLVGPCLSNLYENEFWRMIPTT